MAKQKTEALEEAAPEPEGPRGFAPFLQQIDDGELHTELSKTTQQLVGELYDFADRYRRPGKGTLTVTLSFSVDGNGAIAVAGDVKTKTPKKPRAASVFFRTPGNNLSIENPRQQKLPLREVPASQERPREVNTETAPKAL